MSDEQPDEQPDERQPDDRQPIDRQPHDRRRRVAGRDGAGSPDGEPTVRRPTPSLRTSGRVADAVRSAGQTADLRRQPGRVAPDAGRAPGRLTPPGRIGQPGRPRGGVGVVGSPAGRTAPAGARTRRTAGLDVPREHRRTLVAPRVDPEFFGKLSERFARFMGTARFIFYMTVFVGIWLAWNTFGPASLQFDPRALNYTLLTLILSLQASYAAPLILLAQNRQDDRDRVSFEQDRQRSERSLADTEYLAREIVALRIALRDVATRDFVRSELRDLLAELAGPDQDATGPS
jgi:uncharacterized membrane protein